METKPDLSGWTHPDLSLPAEPPTEQTKRCIGCGVEVPDGEAPACGH